MVQYIPVGTETVERYAYYERTDITGLVFPDGLCEIGESAFMGCSGIKEVVLPESVRKISWNAFSGCTSLATVWLPFGLCEIGWGAFRDCSSLSELVVPISVTEIGDSAFEGCTNLRKITLPTAFRGREASLGIPETAKVVFEDWSSAFPQPMEQEEPPPPPPKVEPAPPPPKVEPEVKPQQTQYAPPPRPEPQPQPAPEKKKGGVSKLIIVGLFVLIALKMILPIFEPKPPMEELPSSPENSAYTEEEEEKEPWDYEEEKTDEYYEPQEIESAEIPETPEAPINPEAFLADLYNRIEENNEIQHTWIQTPEYNELVESLSYGECYIYIPNDDGSGTGAGIGIYRVDYPQYDEVGAYGEGFLYYGNFVDGKRSGWGIWLVASNGRYYCYRGDWQYDEPNGHGEIREYNEGVYTDMNSRRTRVISGELTSGLWDGPVNWNFEYENGETRENVFNFSYGNTSTTYNANKPNFPYSIDDTDGLLAFPVDMSVESCGIIGFDEAGARIFVYPNP